MEITPDPEPDPGNIGDSWVDWPVDPEPEPDPEDGMYDNSYEEGSSNDNNNSGGNTNGDGTIKVPVIIGNIASETNMNEIQIKKLKDALTYVKNGIWGSRLYNELVNNGVKLSFMMTTTHPNKIAFFTKEDNSIKFTGTNYIEGEHLIEEIIHAVQFNLYYGDKMRDDIRNFEFEAKVVKDIDCERSARGCALSGAMGMDDNEEFCNNYGDFVYFNGTWDSNAQSTYNGLGETWNQYNGDFDPSITPELLINYLNN